MAQPPRNGALMGAQPGVMGGAPAPPQQPRQPAAPVPQQQQLLAAAAASQVHPHLLGIMTNPTLAAAAAASPLFPPAAMLSNPGAYLAMPEAFQAAGLQAGQAPGGNAATANAVGTTAAPGLMAATSGGVGTAGPVLQNVGVPMQNPVIPNTFDEINNPASKQAAIQVSSMGSLAGFSGATPAQTISMQQLTAAKAADGNSDTNGSGAAARIDRSRRAELTPAERAKQNRDRNREHARSTRLRKKAYVQKLKELVEGLHAERTEEVRQRRVAIQHLAEIQNVRRAVIISFLKFHAAYETDESKWRTILEDNVWLRQPVTPYRSFRRAEIEQECRVSRGIDAVIGDSASLSVMIESVGMKSPRWMQLKRQEFLELEQAKRGGRQMPRCISRQESRLHHAISSLSNTSSSGGSSGEEQERKKPKGHSEQGEKSQGSDSKNNGAKKVSSSSGSAESSSTGSNGDRKQKDASKDFHDYHAKPLPDPKLVDSERSSQSGEDDSSDGGKKRGVNSTDSSTGDDSAAAIAAPRYKRQKKEDSMAQKPAMTAGMAAYAARVGVGGQPSLPPNIAKSGGIQHNLKPVVNTAAIKANGTARLSLAPAVALPPFAGIGKRPGLVSQSSVVTNTNSGKEENSPAVVSADQESTCSSTKRPQIRGYYHINEDDMILMDDVIMCPFVFRSQDAVMCGALAECVMPGMLRSTFNSRNKLTSCELVYDSMGMMQMLERASGNEGSAQIIPGSLEMALAPTQTEARVITLAEPPYLIVNVNEVWTRTTGYTQMEVEGQEYLSLLEGEGTVPEASTRPGRPSHLLKEVAKGRCACSTNIHYDREGRDFIEFVCSYPLTNGNDEVSHLLHVSKELPSLRESSS